LGQIPFGGASDQAALRVALRTVQGKIEICRERTAEELAALPQHMRTPSVCDEHTPHYQLRVAVDGGVILEQEVVPGGLRGDRPLIVDRQVEVAPGRAVLEIDFSPILPPASTAEEAVALSELPHYRFDQPLEFEPGRITLMTIDDDAGELVVYGQG
jgi:hypothetical protein